MKRKKSLVPLGETELEVLQHVWSLKEATVAEVQARIMHERPVAYTTVMTVMKNLTEKGYLTADREGHSFRYWAARSPESVRGSVLRTLLGKVFDGSPTALVQSLVKQESLSETERAEIRRLIDGMEGSDERD